MRRPRRMEMAMRISGKIATTVAALAGLGMLAAGPIMLVKAFDGKAQVSSQLVAQKITFPPSVDKGLPPSLAKYAGKSVTTGPLAKAYADMVEIHVKAATNGKTYSEVSSAYMAGGGKDAALGALRQTAFMGESLRGSLMGAYQAWEVSLLVIGLGFLVTGLGVVFTVGAAAVAVASRPRIKVPDSPEALITERELAHS